jgi:hypothetical protein
MAEPAFFDGFGGWDDNNDYAAFGWDNDANGRVRLLKQDGVYGAGLNVSYSTAGIDSGSYWSDLSEFYIGFWMNNRDPNGTGFLFSLKDSGSGGSVHCNAHVASTDGTLKVGRGGYPGTIIATSTTKINQADNAWNHIKIRFKLSNTAGEVQFIINGTEDTAATGLDNCVNANEYMNYVFFSNFGFNHNMTDVWVDANDFGQLRSRLFVPTADGTTTDFTPSTGTDHYAMLDEFGGVTPNSDGDTTYNESTTLTDIDLTTPTVSLPAGAVIKTIRASHCTRGTSGGEDIRLVCRSGGTNYYSAAKTLTTAYVGNNVSYENDPDTSSAWTTSGATNAEWGIENNA